MLQRQKCPARVEPLLLSQAFAIVASHRDLQRAQIEARIRAAMDRLLRGDIQAGTKCDVKTLVREASLTRAALYSTYAHLKDEFEKRRARLQEEGSVVDPRQNQITRLKTEVDRLKKRVAEREGQIEALTTFRTAAISRSAAQHTEVELLRQQLASR